MVYIENREIKHPDSNNWEIKTQIHEKPTKQQRNQNNPYPYEINPKNREIITNPYQREINPKNTEKSKSTNTMRNQTKEHTEKSKPNTQTTIQNYRNQIAQISPQTQDLWDKKREH